MKVLHISLDDIFINAALEQFDTCELDKNDLMIWSDNESLKKTARIPTKIYPIGTNKKELKAFVSTYDLVILHSLTVENATIVNQCLSPKQKSVWMLHGYEAYSTSVFSEDEIISKKTQSYFGNKKKSKLKKLIRPLIETVIETDNKSILSAAKNVDYLGILYKEEFEFISSKMDMNAKWFPFSYYPLNKIIGNNSDLVSGQNILLGNSATSSNNHIDILDVLSKADLSDRKVICPLSYGDLEYARQLNLYGSELIPESFFALNKFMELKEYNELLNTCSICIMNHQRQQAVGTVMAMIYKGSKVYLNKHNTLYPFLKRMGIEIKSTNDINPEHIDLLPLSSEQQLSNQTIIKSFLTEEALRRPMINLLNELDNQ